MAMIRRLSSSAASVRPRSSIRYAACSWARATMRSASSWALSMIRSPSWLMRFAARTSSGTATRSSSIRLRAASWSMMALRVSGSGFPFAISHSSRSTRKMMSSGPSPVGSGPRRGVARLWHAFRRATRRSLSGPGPVRRSIAAQQLRPDRLGRRRRNHRRHVAAELRDLLDEARADVRVLQRGHEEHGVDVRRQLLVVVRQLELRVEVADRSQPAHEERGAETVAVVDGEALEGVDVDRGRELALALERRADDRDARL